MTPAGIEPAIPGSEGEETVPSPEGTGGCSRHHLTPNTRTRERGLGGCGGTGEEAWGRKGSLHRDSLPNQREVPGLYIYGPRGAVKELVYCLGASSPAPRS